MALTGNDASLPSIQTIVRVNAEAADRDIVSTDREMNEVRLAKLEGYGNIMHSDTAVSWVVDAVVDGIEEHNDIPTFATQQTVYDTFQQWHKSALLDGVSIHNCLFVGGRGSGKSYSMLGDNTKTNQGLIPRFIRSLFQNGEAKITVQMSVYMAYDDYVADLLAPPHTYPYRGNVIYSSTMGPQVLPMQTCVCDNSRAALHTLHLAVQAASVLALNTHDPLNTGHLLICLSVHSTEPFLYYTVNFVEITSTTFLAANLTPPDRLSGGGGFATANAFAQCGFFGNTSNGHNVLSPAMHHQANGKKGENKCGRPPPPSGDYELSFLTYFLQEALLLTESPPSPQLNNSKTHTDAGEDGRLNVCKGLPAKYATLVVGCVRGCGESSNEDHRTLELLQVTADRVMAAQATLAAGRKAGEGKSGAEDAATVTAESESNPSPPDESRRRDHTIQAALAGILTEIQMMDSDIACLSEGPSGKGRDGRVPELITFLGRKKCVLQTLQRFLEVPASFLHRNQPLTAPMSVPAVIQTWLKRRGVLGVVIDEDDRPALDDMFRVLPGENKQPEPDRHSSDPEEEWTGPWSAVSVEAPTGPYLTPVTSADFPRHYLQLLLPGGHLAVCGSPLADDLIEVEIETRTKPVVPGLKHCKVFHLAGELQEKHCVFFRLGTSVKIRPLHDSEGHVALVRVNGQIIVEETTLHTHDTVCVGSHCMFVVTIPGELDSNALQGESASPGSTGGDAALPPQKGAGGSDQLTGSDTLQGLTGIVSATSLDLFSKKWERCVCAVLQQEFLEVLAAVESHRRHQQHMHVEREYVEIAKKSEMSGHMFLDAYEPSVEELRRMCLSMTSAAKAVICEALLMLERANRRARQLRREVRYVLQLEPVCEPGSAKDEARRGISAAPSWGCVYREYRGVESGVCIDGRRYSVHVRADMLDDGNCTGRGDSWIWPLTTFLRRSLMIEGMYASFLTACGGDLEILEESYPIATDPFFDPSEPELIGVATLHMDSVFSLCDVKDHLPVVTFKGTKGGLLKMTLRAWIDEVETVPSYICVDKESKLSDFPGRKCILRFYFDSLLNTSPSLSKDVQIVFTFFCHRGQYRTTRHPVRNTVEGDTHPFLNSTVVVEQKITPDFIRYVQRKCLELEVWGSRVTNQHFEKVGWELFRQMADRIGDAALVSASWCSSWCRSCVWVIGGCYRSIDASGEGMRGPIGGGFVRAT